MGRSKDQWMTDVEAIEDDYLADNITRDEAIDELMRLGFDRGEADDMLTECEK